MTLIPVQITFRGLQPSDTLESDIREKVAWLEQFHPRLVGCRVLLELPHRHRHEGRLFHVRIEIGVPGGEPIVVNHEPSLHGPRKDSEALAHRKESDLASVHRHARAAVHEAFDAARRRLQDFARTQRGEVKTHEPALP